MIQNISLICGIQILERFAYYGLRSILLLFLVQTLGWDRFSASSFYGLLTMLVIIGPLFSGILGDLIRRPLLLALIGSVLSALGVLALAFSSSELMVKFTLIIVALGSVLYKPSIISALYQNTWPKKPYFDLVYGIFYFCVNLGAFAAPLIIGFTADTVYPEDFRTGFLICSGAFWLVAILLASFYKTLTTNRILYYSQPFSLSGNAIGLLVLSFPVGLIFWTGYQLFSSVSALGQGSSSMQWSAVLAVIAALLVLPLSLFLRFRGAWKIGLGLGLTCLIYLAFAWFGLAGLPSLIILSIAEMLVAPILFSQVIQTGSPKFTGTLAGGLIAMTWLTNQLSSWLMDGPMNMRANLILLALILFALGIGIVLIDRLRPRENQPS